MHNIEIKGVVKKASEHEASEVFLESTQKNLAEKIKDYIKYSDIRILCCEDKDGGKFIVIEETIL